MGTIQFVTSLHHAKNDLMDYFSTLEVSSSSSRRRRRRRSSIVQIMI